MGSGCGVNKMRASSRGSENERGKRGGYTGLSGWTEGQMCRMLEELMHPQRFGAESR